MPYNHPIWYKIPTFQNNGLLMNRNLKTYEEKHPHTRGSYNVTSEIKVPSLKNKIPAAQGQKL